MDNIIRCKDCKFQRKVWRYDKRLKAHGYYTYGCEFLSDTFADTPVWGKDNQFCSSAERKEDGE